MNFYKILKIKKLGRGSPDFWTRLFAKHTGGGSVKPVIVELTGRLPLFFKTTETKLRDWVIYGNNDVGENLVENIEQGTWTMTGFVKSNARTRCRVGNVIDVVGSQQYTMHLECPSHIGRLNIQFKNDTGKSIGETGWQSVGESGSYTATIPSSATKATIILAIDTGAENCTPANFTNVMLVKGSTAPDHYIPYQQGVGERTENLFDGSTIQKGRIDNGTPGYAQDTTSATFVNGVISFTTIDNRYRGVYFDLIDIEGQFTYKVENKTGTVYLYFDYYDSKQTWISRASTNPLTFPFSITLTPPSNAKFLRFSIQNVNIGDASLTNVSIVKGSSVPSTYVPYGYQIPLAVKQQGQPDKTVDIYIGDSPLTEDETVSKTSTGQDIELFNGENTVSTTLYNKPTMEIKYIKRRKLR